MRNTFGIYSLLCNYSESGGVFYISPQVIILDILKKQIGRSISGIFVTHAHRVLRKKEANFILNLAKFTGVNFVHCISDSPVQISKDLEKIMSSLMVSNVELFPRFHELVKKDFMNHQPKLENIVRGS